MTSLLLVFILCMSALSLGSYLYCWGDIQGKNPHILSLRQITSIMDRHILVLLFGAYEPGYFFSLSAEKLRLFNRAWGGAFLREIAADGLCMYGAYRYLSGGASMESVWWFILLAGACQAINFAFSLWLVKQWKHQIIEELTDEWE